MKIVKILGGLGNQMFQYAFFLSIQKRNKNSKIDLTDFTHYGLHQGFELSKVFNIDLEGVVASVQEVNKVKDNSMFFRIRKKLGFFIFGNPNIFLKNSHFIQPNFSEYRNINNLENPSYLEGYWQTERYFKDYKQDILDIFNWTDISQKNLEVIEKMETENSVAIHIRHFDKPKNLRQLIYYFRLRMVWRICSKEFYLKSMDYFTSNTKNPVFYICTDNISWVKRNLPTSIKYKIIDWNRNEDSHFDMLLMSKCKHNIISMSSFSWWSAWLNQNPNKIVIAPKRWAPRFEKDLNIIPKEWLRF